MLRANQSPDRADQIWKRLPGIVQSLSASRPIEAALVRSQMLATEGAPLDAAAVLCKLFESAPPGFAGWTVPIEPFLAQLHRTEAFREVLHALTERAR